MKRIARLLARSGQSAAAALAWTSAGWWAAGDTLVLGQEPPAQYRSVTDARPRIPDEHDRPYFRETQSHRGWEVREAQFTVFAATSADDARLAAAHVADAWNDAAALTRRWTTVADNPDFGLSALQIVIDNEPVRETDAPLTTVNVVGIRTQVLVNASAGRPGLPTQLQRLREGAAFAALHAAGLDSTAPPWVVAGLAGHIGRAGLTPAERQQQSESAAALNFGAQQWRFSRSASDRLDYQRIDHAGAADQVAFLLTGDDAAHAPAFLAALRTSNTSAASAAAQGAALARFPGNPQLARSDTAFDQLQHQLASEFAAWKENPSRGQPVFEPDTNAGADVVAAQREMLVALKLQRRFGSQRDTGADANAGGGLTRTKIVTFDKLQGALKADPAAAPTPPLSFHALVARLTDPARPAWATLDADGSLLFSTDTRRVQELLGGFEQPYVVEHGKNPKDQVILTRRLDGQRTLRGWLAENPQDKSRPLAKFEIKQAGKTGLARSAPAALRQASAPVATGPHER